MWIFTQDGFVSVVDKEEVPGTVVVRARDRMSLEPIAELFETEIVPSPLSDYQYRTHVTRQQLIEWMTLNIQTFDYDNFKTRVYATRGAEFAHVLSNVWDVMNDVADDESVARLAEISARMRAERAATAHS
jgi:hypothetical protein